MAHAITGQFEQMGARVKLSLLHEVRGTRTWNGGRSGAFTPSPVRVDVQRDSAGEYFEVAHRPDVVIRAVDVRRTDRHLLLLARESGAGTESAMSKFLCGHDERAWFVAAVPETAVVRNVQDAKDALKPKAVWDAIRDHNVPMHDRDRRRTAAFVRQGEWFFIPRPQAPVNPKLILRSEPIRRGAGKPHVCQFMCRSGGEQVRVSARYPNGLTAKEFRKLNAAERERQHWTIMVRDARVFVKGAVRHPDHATIHLQGWHEVVMNTETQARAMRHVAFLD